MTLRSTQRATQRATLRVAFVSVIRPNFKGDSAAAARRSLEGLRALGEELDFEVVLPGSEIARQQQSSLPSFAVDDAQSAQSAASEIDDLAPDLLLIQHTTFATGDLLAPLLAVPVPAALWALPEDAGGRGAEGPLPLNSLCGVNMTLSMLQAPPVERDLPVKWLYGEANSDWFRRRLAPTVDALRALRAVRSARILQIGGTAPHFYGLEEQPDWPGLVGARIEQMDLSSLYEAMSEVAGEEARELARQWQQTENSTVSDEQLERTATVEVALRRLANDGGFTAVALRCWPELPERCDTMACAALGGLAQGGLPAACEGDVMGALSMLALQGAGGGEPLLMDLSDIDPERGAFFWHCGNGPRSWAGPAGTKLTTHFNRDGVGTVRDMVLAPGAATGFRLVDGGRRALLFEGEYDGRGGGFDGVRGWLGNLSWNGEAAGPSQFLANVLDRRLPHHFAFGKGSLGSSLRELCGWLGSELIALEPERDTL